MRKILSIMLFTSALSIIQINPAYSAAGDTDSAISFNGSSYASVADPGTSPFDITGTVTIEAWVYAQSACSAAGGQGIVAKNFSYMLYCASGNWAYAFSSNGSTWTGTTTNMPVEQNVWHHLALTHSSANTNLLFYYDGQLLETYTSNVPSSMTTNNNDFSVGTYGTNYFTGKIDEVRVYSSQRTASQVLADMNNWGPNNDANLIAYYDFNDQSGSTIYNVDSTPSSNTNLTVSGSISYASIESSTAINGDAVITFPRSYLTANGGWKIPSNVTSMKSLVIAGGGGGGSRAGGGGGAGGYIYDAALSVTANSYQSIIVGAGGPALAYKQGWNGLNSSLGSLRIAIGGGGGGHASRSDNVTRAGVDGGSGGGASGDWNGTGSSAAYGLTTQNSTYGYGVGNNGGSGYSGGTWGSGGGGGANGSGQNSTSATNTAGKGGNGITDPIAGTSTCFATGGGGGIYAGYTLGAGGDCGGGSTVNNNAGSAGSSTTSESFARANTGSGGGGNGYNASGADYNGGYGASGIIILRYPLASIVSITFSGGSNATYRTVGILTATSNLPGRVTFYEKGKVISGCKKVATNASNIATCSWRPSLHGFTTISATATPTNTYVSNGSNSITLTIAKRITTR